MSVTGQAEPPHGLSHILAYMLPLPFYFLLSLCRKIWRWLSLQEKKLLAFRPGWNPLSRTSKSCSYRGELFEGVHSLPLVTTMSQRSVFLWVVVVTTQQSLFRVFLGSLYMPLKGPSTCPTIILPNTPWILVHVLKGALNLLNNNFSEYSVDPCTYLERGMNTLAIVCFMWHVCWHPAYA